MRKAKFALLGVLALVMTTAVPASAITYGQPDAGEHPYVGFMIFFSPADPGWFSCSGTLLDSNTFLTAGHCTFPVGTNSRLTAGNSGGNDVWVTFQEQETLRGWPARADYPDEATLYAARSSWLNNNSAYTRGRAYPHPQYDDFASFPRTHDMGVVQLSRNSRISSHGVVAPVGTVDQMAAVSSDKNDILVETSGYGIQSVEPKPMDVESRYKSTSRITEINGNASKGGNLHTSNNPSATGGIGGSCFGDSGGPVLQNNTNVVLAVVSWGNSNTCHGADYSWRVDTREAQTFLAQFLR